jgi:ABC-type Fe3+/spermidine/putrescine transport system ATPase subunit
MSKQASRKGVSQGDIPQPDIALSMRGLARRYGSVEALAGVDLEVARGELFSLLGPSGSGKTTLLRLVAGFEIPDAGQVRINGVAMNGAPPERRGLGVVFQEYALFPHRTVAENIGFGLKMRGLPRPERRARVAEMLALVRLEDVALRRPDSLSGGQRQRVALARALAPGPELLLLDEPLANLDRRLRESLREELLRVHRAAGVTTLLITHDQEEALTLADRMGILRDGRLEQTGPPTELWQRPATRFVAGFLGEMNVLRAERESDQRAFLPDLGESVPFSGEALPNGSAVVCIRPEALELCAPRNGVVGRVERLAYAGGHVTYHVRLQSVSILVRELLSDGVPRWALGDNVSLVVNQVPSRLLPA